MPRKTAEFKIWFDIPDDPDQGRVEIRSLTDVEISSISTKATKTRFVFDPVLNQVVREQGYDLMVDRQETMVAAVTNWENFYDESGQPMACTPDNKRTWACNGPVFSFVRDKMEAVAEEAKKRQEEKRKNSKALPSGSPA